MSNWNRSTKAAAATAAFAAFALVAPTASASPSPGADRVNRQAPGNHLNGLDVSGTGTDAANRSAKGKPGAGDVHGIQESLDGLIANGAVGAVARVDSPSSTGAFASGKRALDANPKALPHSEFRVASNTKMMIATLVMQRVQAGEWSLGTTIGEVLPGLVPGHDDVTLEQLLSHTSGMPDGLGALLLSRMEDPNDVAESFEVLSQDYSDQQIVDAMNSLPWKFAPGTDFFYSNTGYVVLGLMLEKQTGRSVGDLLKRDVFKPAGMNQTTFKTAAGMKGSGLEGAAFYKDQSFSLADFNPEVFSSAGAVVSTTKDLNRFTDALLDGRLVNRDLLEQMKTPRSSKDMEYGLGIYRIPDPCTPAGQAPNYLYGHDGGAYGTVSVSFGSDDGTRQISMGVTGRHYFDDPKAPQPYDLNQVAGRMLLASC